MHYIFAIEKLTILKRVLRGTFTYYRFARTAVVGVTETCRSRLHTSFIVGR
jgi:hypothetical protein